MPFHVDEGPFKTKEEILRKFNTNYKTEDVQSVGMIASQVGTGSYVIFANSLAAITNPAAEVTLNCATEADCANRGVSVGDTIYLSYYDGDGVEQEAYATLNHADSSTAVAFEKNAPGSGIAVTDFFRAKMLYDVTQALDTSYLKIFTAGAAASPHCVVPVGEQLSDQIAVMALDNADNSTEVAIMDLWASYDTTAETASIKITSTPLSALGAPVEHEISLIKTIGQGLTKFEECWYCKPGTQITAELLDSAPGGTVQFGMTMITGEN